MSSDQASVSSLLTGTRPPLWLLMMLAASSGMSLLLFLPALPVMVSDFGVGLGTIQWVITGYLLAVGAMQLVIGPAVDRLGRRTVLLASVICFTLVSLFALSVERVEVLILCRVLQGASVSAMSVVSRAVVHDVFHGVEAARAMSFITIGIQVPGFVAPILGGLLTYYLGWETLFVFLAGYGGLLLALVFSLLPETVVKREATAHRGIHKALEILRDYLSLLGSLHFTAHVVMVALCASAAMTMNTVLPSALTELGLSPDLIGYFTSANAIAAIGGAILSAQLVARTGVNRLIVTSLGVAVCFVTAYLLYTRALPYSILNLFVLFMVVSACQAIVISMGFAEALRVNDHLRGLASGLAGSGTSIITASLAGIAAGLYAIGLVWSLTMVLTCYLAGLLIALLLRYRSLLVPVSS
ncbi:MFS transporter [Seongchinamella unica]|nr:MFS transporter [Seongchinamella unica]